MSTIDLRPIYNPTNRPCAAQGLTSYRYRGWLGFVMIGARSDADALKQAARSIECKPDARQLEVWNGSEYVAAKCALAAMEGRP